MCGSSGDMARKKVRAMQKATSDLSDDGDTAAWSKAHKAIQAAGEHVGRHLAGEQITQQVEADFAKSGRKSATRL